MKDPVQEPKLPTKVAVLNDGYHRWLADDEDHGALSTDQYREVARRCDAYPELRAIVELLATTPDEEHVGDELIERAQEAVK